MPILWIEFFGAEHLDRAFWIIGLMTAPVWLMMLLFGCSRLVRRIAHPFVFPPLYCGVLFYLLWESYLASILPEPVRSVDYQGASELLQHPVALLALLCNLQILNLALGTMMYQKACRTSMAIPFELLLCWIFGAPAVLIFGLRLLLLRKVFD